MMRRSGEEERGMGGHRLAGGGVRDYEPPLSNAPWHCRLEVSLPADAVPTPSPMQAYTAMRQDSHVPRPPQDAPSSSLRRWSSVLNPTPTLTPLTHP